MIKHPVLFLLSAVFLVWLIWKFILRNERRPHRTLYISVMSQERWETSGAIRRRLEKIYGGWINRYEFALYMRLLITEGLVIQKKTRKGFLFRVRTGHPRFFQQPYTSLQNA